MFKRVAIVLVNYKDYAEKYLPACWASLVKQDYAGEIKVFIVDNESSAISLQFLKSIAPEAEIIINKNNDGFAKGDNDAMKRALELGFDFIILFNMDTVVEKDCVSKMVEAAERPHPRLARRACESRRANPQPDIGLAGLLGKERGEAGAVQARLMLWPRDLTQPSPSKGEGKINSLGNVTHFLGFGYSEGYGEKYNAPYSSPLLLKEREICYPSGAAVLFKAEILKQVGLFDEEFWMYNEDQDLGWRIWLAGYKCVLAPEAVVYHKYEFSRSIKKYYYMDRNRLIAILKNYHWATLVLILPAFVLMEAGLMLFAYKNGWFKEKIKVYRYFLSARNWRHILAARKHTQSLRRLKDWEIVRLFSGRIWYQEIGETRLKIANVLFNAYWKVVRVLIRW